MNAKTGVNFKVNKDLLLYATFGRGFRDGGSNSGLGASCYANDAAKNFSPDTLNNFEVGWKSTLMNGRMSWNGAFYYMPWKNYQAPVFDLAICPLGFNANLGNARIYGAESNFDFKVTEGLTVQFAASYNDSRLVTNTFFNPEFIVTPGERLPYVPYFSYSANARYQKLLSASLKGYFQYDIAHKGDMWSDLRAINPTALRAPCSLHTISPICDLASIQRASAGVRRPTSRISSTRMQSSSPTPATTTTVRPPTSRGRLVFA